MGCPGQESALLSTDHDFTALSDTTVQVKHYVHRVCMWGVGEVFFVHTQIAAVSHLIPSEKVVLALSYHGVVLAAAQEGRQRAAL